MRATGRTPKYTKEERRDIALEYFTTNKSRGELADEYGVAKTTIDRYVKEFSKEFKEVAFNDKY